MKTFLATLASLILARGAYGATNNVTPTAIYRVWTTGNANNGGCFDPANQGATGIDYSKQAAAQFTVITSLTTSGAGSTTLTQAAGTWDNTVLGNCIHITAGTNFTQGFYVVTGFTDSNNIVLNLSPTPSGAGSGGTGAIGGAVASLATAATGVAPGNTVYIRATGTYAISAGVNFSTSGTSGLPISWIGYAAADNDGGPAVLQITAGSVSIISAGGALQRFMNLTLDCNSQSNSRAAYFTGGSSIFQNLLVKNCTTKGLLLSSGTGNIVKDSVFTGNSGNSIDFGTTYGHQVRGNVFYANTATTVADAATTAGALTTYDHNLFANNTGATTDGISKSAGGNCLAIMGNVFYGNGRDGLRLTGSSVADCLSLRNNIIYGNAGVGLNIVTTNWSARNIDVDYNGIGGNGANRNNAPAGSHDVALSADPFANGAGNVFTLNSAPGGGAALKAVGSPGIFPLGGTGYLDIGPLQSQSTGGGGTRTCAQ